MADTIDDIIQAVEKRLKKQPRSPLFAQLASYYLEGGRADDALRVCDEGLAHHPFYSTGHLMKGKALFALKMSAEAHREFALVNDLLPDVESIARLLSETGGAEMELTSPVEVAPPSLEESPTVVEPTAMESPMEKAPPMAGPAETAPVDLEFAEPAVPMMETSAAPEVSTEDAFAISAPPVEEPSPFGGLETPTAEPTMAAPMPGEETFDQFSARTKHELAGTENTLSLDDYLSGNVSAPPSDASSQIEDLAQKLQGAKMTPVIDLSARSSESGGGASSGFVTPTLAEIYVKQGWYDDAIRAYKTLSSTKPEEKDKFEQRIAEIEEMKKQHGG